MPSQGVVRRLPQEIKARQVAWSRNQRKPEGVFILGALFTLYINRAGWVLGDGLAQRGSRRHRRRPHPARAGPALIAVQDFVRRAVTMTNHLDPRPQPRVREQRQE